MSNPALNNNSVEKFIQHGESLEAMSISGAVIKTLFLLAVLTLTSSYTFLISVKGFIDKAMMMGTVGALGALVVAMVLIFSRKPAWMAPLSMLYAILEGLAVGGYSALFALQYGGGIVINAAIATFATLFFMLFLYSSRIIKCTEKFMAVITTATLSVLVIYLVTFLVSLFNPTMASMLMGSGPVGIGFSAIVCVIAAFNFIADFSIIENGKTMGLSKDFEWYGAFSLMVTIVWLYLEVLKLLAKLNSRR